MDGLDKLDFGLMGYMFALTTAGKQYNYVNKFSNARTCPKRAEDFPLAVSKLIQAGEQNVNEICRKVAVILSMEPAIASPCSAEFAHQLRQEIGKKLGGKPGTRMRVAPIEEQFKVTSFHPHEADSLPPVCSLHVYKPSKSMIRQAKGRLSW